MVEAGTLWWAGEDKKFRVLNVTEIEGHTWVHYREEPKRYTPVNECKEYSCYIESFELRFRKVPE